MFHFCVFLVLVLVRSLFILSTDPDFIHFEFWSGFYPRSPGLDFINCEPGQSSDFTLGSGFYPFLAHLSRRLIW